MCDRDKMLEEGFFIEGGRYVRNDQATPKDYESRQRFLKSFGHGDDETPSEAMVTAEEDGDLFRAPARTVRWRCAAHQR